MFRLLLTICFILDTGANHARDRKIGIITIASFLMLQFGPGQAAEIKDPMQPPEYAGGPGRTRTCDQTVMSGSL